MKLLTILAFVGTVCAVSAEGVCPPTEVVVLLDKSENAARASSTDRDLFPFDILKDAITRFLTHPAVASAANFRFGAFGYSSSPPQDTFIQPGSTPAQALSRVPLISNGPNGGSWTYRGMEMINFSPAYPNNMLLYITSQGSNDTDRRDLALQQYNRIAPYGWRPYVIVGKGFNNIDYPELRIVNSNREPVTLIDRNPTNPNDPKGYKDLSIELNNIINNILCTASPTTTPATTPTPAPQTRPTTPRPSGLCSQCLFEGGYGYDFDPLYCDTFFQCFPGNDPIKKHCPAGTFWDGSQCNFISKVPCPTAPCNATINDRYPSGKCCNKFFACNGGTFSEQACPVGQAYDAASRSCFQPTNLTTYCAAQNKFICDVNKQGPVGPGACVGYAPDPFGDPCKYMNWGVSQRVAPGTTWSQSACSLTWFQGSLCLNTGVSDKSFTGEGGPAENCTAVFVATYDGGSRDVYSERLNQKLDIYSSYQEVTFINNALTFSPEANNPFLYYFFFANREFQSNFAFKIRFRLDQPQLNVNYDILSNNYCSLCPETISITATATSSTRNVVTATFVTTLGIAVTTSAIIEKNNPTDMFELIVIVGDSSVFGKVYAINSFNTVYASSDFNRVDKPAGANVRPNRCGLQIGRGPNKHWQGVIDDFRLYEHCRNITSILR